MQAHINEYLFVIIVLIIIYLVLEFISQYKYLKKIIKKVKTKHKNYWKKTKSFENIIFTYSPLIRYCLINHKKLPKDKEILDLAKKYRKIEIIKYFIILLIVILIINLLQRFI